MVWENREIRVNGMSDELVTDYTCKKIKNEGAGDVGGGGVQCRCNVSCVWNSIGCTRNQQLQAFESWLLPHPRHLLLPRDVAFPVVWSHRSKQSYHQYWLHLKRNRARQKRIVNIPLQWNMSTKMFTFKSSSASGRSLGSIIVQSRRKSFNSSDQRSASSSGGKPLDAIKTTA